ncbi:MAG: hypothetical protein ACI9P7_002319 [Candidatus Azotimanducaceae bacterium]|jgi:hypothetical protein
MLTPPRFSLSWLTSDFGTDQVGIRDSRLLEPLTLPPNPSKIPLDRPRAKYLGLPGFFFSCLPESIIGQLIMIQYSRYILARAPSLELFFFPVMLSEIIKRARTINHRATWTD